MTRRFGNTGYVASFSVNSETDSDHLPRFMAPFQSLHCASHMTTLGEYHTRYNRVRLCYSNTSNIQDTSGPLLHNQRDKDLKCDVI